MNDPLILVTSVGRASGARAAAAALACAGLDPDRSGLLIDVGGRPPRPTLLASAGARELEERLAAHLPEKHAAARGSTCHLSVEDGPAGFGAMRAALPLCRGAVAVIHLAPSQVGDVLDEPGLAPSAVLLRADLTTDRALSALAVRRLASRGLRVRILDRALTWMAARRALFGVLPPGAPGALPPRLTSSLLETRRVPRFARIAAC